MDRAQHIRYRHQILPHDPVLKDARTVIDVYALLPKGRLKLPRIAICVEALRQAIAEIA